MGRRLALLIGTLTFEDPKLRRLQKPAADVASLAGVLRDPLIGGFDDVQTTIDPSVATARRAVAALFAQKAADDLVLLYFAGHGIKDEYAQLYLATTDTESELLSATTLAADFVTREMDRSRSRKQILILDCCFSGAFAGTRAPATVGAAHAFATDAAGRVILTASDAFQYAWENETTVSPVNSLFTHYLVDGLLTGKADTNNDGIITADEWYDYVYTNVRAATPKQTPQRTVYAGAGSLLVARNPQPSLSLPDEVTSALKSPLPYVREGVAHELARLLVGSHLGLRAAARDALQQLTTDMDSRVRNLASTKLASRTLNRRPATSEPREATTAPSASATPFAQPITETTTTDFDKGLFIFVVLEFALFVEAAFLLVSAANKSGMARNHPGITPLAIAIMLLATTALVRWRGYRRHRERRNLVIVVFLVLTLLVGVAPIVYVNLRGDALLGRTTNPITAFPAPIPSKTITAAKTIPERHIKTSTETIGVTHTAPIKPPPTDKASAGTRVRLSAINGRILDLANQSKAWTPLSHSSFVVENQKEKRATLLVFWATWCTPCVAQLPLLDQLREQHASGVTVVGLIDEIDSAVDRKRIDEVLKPYSFRMNYIIQDPSIGRQIFGQPDLPLPAFALFDTNGELIFSHIGSLTDQKTAEALRAILETIAAKQKKH
ncbi:MAG: hypothetical protein QOI58_902 [Thermoanaerobaculia bacterium]|jgi:thiol-disulfide isomerase/thioredoxin|nr:hypothetical protein [Thermoanaerobaculia bacterium]